MRIKILDLLMGNMYNSVECRSGHIFLMWGHKRNKKCSKLGIFYNIQIPKIWEKIYNLQR